MTDKIITRKFDERFRGGFRRFASEEDEWPPPPPRFIFPSSLSRFAFLVRLSLSLIRKERYRESFRTQFIVEENLQFDTQRREKLDTSPLPKKKLTSPSVRLAVSKYSCHASLSLSASFGSISLSLSLSVPRRVDNVYISFFFFFLRESAEKKRSKRSKTQKKNLRSKKYTIFIRSPQGRVRALFCVLNGKKASFGLYYY